MKLSELTPEEKRILAAEACCITLTQGFNSYVDACDLELASKYKWRAKRNGRTTYAISDTGGKRVWLHRIIMGVNEPIDHIDNDGLNNRKSNLRIIGNTNNIRRKRPNLNGASRFKGVSYYREGLWQSAIKVNNKSKWLGSFASEEMAATAYDNAARIFFGEYAYLNFPTENATAAQRLDAFLLAKGLAE